MVGLREEAADLTQEVFVRVFRALPTLRAGAAFIVWLRQIAVNLCRDYLKRQRLPTESLERLGDEQATVTRDLPDPVGEPDLPLLTGELKVAVRKAIASLSPDHRAVVIMHHLQGMGVAEIARVLRCSVGTVKSRLSRARDELKRKLSGHVES
jgi:RNA polymerase sigma-70 factor, ECF subfamily